MSFHKRNISDYIKDIPMRFTSNFSQISPENYLNSIDLSPIYVDRLTAADFDYNFSVERIALQDAKRERERVLKEAEEKLKELELNKQLNETQIKKPVEDVINSSKPIQLTNMPNLVDYNLNAKKDYKINETTTSTSNYAYAHSYVTTTSNQPVYNSYNFNTSAGVQEPNALKQTYLATNQSTSSQSCLPQSSNLQTNVQSNIQTSSISNLPANLSNNIQTSLPQTSSSQTGGGLSSTHLPSTNYLPSIQSNMINLSGPISSLASNCITVQSRQSNDQLTKTHYSDSNLQLNNSQLQNNPTNLGQLNTNYNVNQSPLYTQSHPMQTNLSNYSAYPPVTTGINYSMNNTVSNLRGVYSLPATYSPTMIHLNHTPNHQNTVTSINQQSKEQNPIKSNSPTINYNAITNYVPSSSYSNGILMPQQSSLLLNNNNTNKQINDKKTVTNKSDKENDSNDAGSIVNGSKTFDDNSRSATANLSTRLNGKKIDVADFENSSSPFDDALLRSIDEKEELNNIFQQFYHNGAK